MDLDVHGDSLGVFMRIKVRMDITVPIMRFITIYIEQEEEQEHANEMILGGDDEEEERNKKIKKRRKRLSLLHMNIYPTSAIVVELLDTLKSHAQQDLEEQGPDSLVHGCGQLCIRKLK